MRNNKVIDDEAEEAENQRMKWNDKKLNKLQEEKQKGN